MISRLSREYEGNRDREKKLARALGHRVQTQALFTDPIQALQHDLRLSFGLGSGQPQRTDSQYQRRLDYRQVASKHSLYNL